MVRASSAVDVGGGSCTPVGSRSCRPLITIREQISSLTRQSSGDVTHATSQSLTALTSQSHTHTQTLSRSRSRAPRPPSRSRLTIGVWTLAHPHAMPMCDEPNMEHDVTAPRPPLRPDAACRCTIVHGRPRPSAPSCEHPSGQCRDYFQSDFTTDHPPRTPLSTRRHTRSAPQHSVTQTERIVHRKITSPAPLALRAARRRVLVSAFAAGPVSRGYEGGAVSERPSLRSTYACAAR